MLINIASQCVEGKTTFCSEHTPKGGFKCIVGLLIPNRYEQIFFWFKSTYQVCKNKQHIEINHCNLSLLLTLINYSGIHVLWFDWEMTTVHERIISLLGCGMLHINKASNMLENDFIINCWPSFSFFCFFFLGHNFFLRKNVSILKGFWFQLIDQWAARTVWSVRSDLWMCDQWEVSFAMEL